MSAVSSANREKKADDENYWVVGLNKSKLFCVVYKSPDLYPMVRFALLGPWFGQCCSGKLTAFI